MELMRLLEKIIEKLKRNPTDIRFDILRRVLIAHGYILTNIKGSHYRFQKEGALAITIVSHHKKVKKWYIRTMLHILYPSQYEK